MLKTRLKKHKPPKQTSDFFFFLQSILDSIPENDQAIQACVQNKSYFPRLYEN